MISVQLPGEGTTVITGISIRRHKSFHPTQATQIAFDVATPPKPVFLYGINGAGKSAIGEVLHGLSQQDVQFAQCSLTTSHDQPYRILVYNQAFVDRVGFYPVSADGLIKAENARSRRATLRRMRGLWNRSR